MAKFAEKQDLGYALLSDPDGSAVAKFGAARAKGPWAQRKTFIVDDGGILRHTFDAVSVRTHGPDVLERVRALRKR